MKGPVTTTLTLITALALGACSESGGGSGGESGDGADGNGGGFASLLSGGGGTTAVPPAQTPSDTPPQTQPGAQSPSDPLDTTDAGTPRPPSSDDPLIDVDGDGFPDFFADGQDFEIDLDGDGIADIVGDEFIDSDGDGVPDIFGDGLPENFGDGEGFLVDLDGDGVPDSFADLDGNGVPDFLDSDLGGFVPDVGVAPGEPDEGPGGSVPGDPATLVGLWDATLTDEDGEDVTYLEFTSDSEAIIYDFLGDEFAANVGASANCYAIFGGPITAVGGDTYRLTGPGGSLEFDARRDGDRLLFTVTDPDSGERFTIDLPPVSGVSPTDLNSCS